MKLLVAPFTGAWIEISNRSLASLRATVAPFTGAWIEILPQARSRPVMSSLPSRERGLKFHEQTGFLGVLDVAPFAGAWIEMAVVFGASCSLMSLPSRDRHR